MTTAVQLHLNLAAIWLSGEHDFKLLACVFTRTVGTGVIGAHSTYAVKALCLNTASEMKVWVTHV